MRTGTTTSGFVFQFDEARADDMRLVDLISTTMDEDAGEFEKLSASSKVIELLLGKEQKAALFAHIGQSHDGRVPFAVLEKTLTEIMQGGGDALKN